MAKDQAQKSRRLSADESRAGILRTALQVFAERGFHGTTTRELAQAAGVSEALLFRHFPTKNDLYKALQLSCGEMENPDAPDPLAELEPSTASLVVLVHGLVSKMIRPASEISAHENSFHRLMVHSFMEDGTFARSFMRHLAEDVILPLERCLKAAAKAGDLVDSPVRHDLRAWFVEHFSAMLMLNHLPGKPVVDFKIPFSSQVEHATWFALLGMGLKAEAIRRDYHPKALALLSR